VAVPAILFAIFIVTSGGLVFALGVILLGIVALGELYTMMRRARPIDIGGFLAMAALVLLALYEERSDVLIALVAAFPLVFMLALTRARLDNLAWGLAATLFGVVWIGLPLAHAVFLRELPHGG
jgi:phosphatidate cytidylyltransferase